jgi:formylglycine-generating enzyme required for sulfatase activity/tRNA A-37 threonylcarbamoyl transferase component Bud32
MTEREIFVALLDLPDPQARAAYLDRVCGGNGALRARVEALLRAHDNAGSFLGSPAVALPDPNTAATQELSGEAAPSGQANPHDALPFLTPSGRPDSLGRIGHYEMLEVLGRGAFGIVFRAFDEKLHRMVALKVLNEELADNATARKRFLREARAAAAICHEHVVNVFAVDEQPVPYLVMEYVSGQTLQDRFDRSGPVELKEVLRIGQQIADGLAEAHAIGLIHRDIKPANILLENGVERVKISDFGLARAADDGTLTQSGVICGTPMYMAPEQAQEETIDHRADLFSLGSVLYVLCTGRPPFRAANTIAVLKRVCEESPRPIREINPEIPTWLCDIIGRLHEKNPEDRFSSAREVADLLGRCLAELQQHGHVRSKVSALPPRAPSASAPPRAAPGKRRWAIAVAVVLVLGLAGLGFTEATGVTGVGGTVLRLFSPEGTLAVEADDPNIGVTIDGGDLVITGAGLKEIRLKPGEHTIQASKDGKRLSQELITISRNGRQVLRVSREGELNAAPPAAVAPFDAQQAKTHQQAWARHLGANVVTTNSLGMKMVLIPPGKFVMGSGKDEPGWAPQEGPQHEVEISRPFAIGAHEVTVGQFKAFVKATSYVTETEKLGGSLQWDFTEKVHKRDPAMMWMKPGYEQTDEYPVVCVTWNDAHAFCKWLSDKEGVAYTLPTEAQWEYACRAGTTTTWFFGDNEGDLDSHAWRAASSEEKAHPVGQKRPNSWGLYDLYGNAWEWTADRFDAGYYALSPKVDPPGADAGSRAMRGGSRTDGPVQLRSGARGWLDQDVGNNVVGFRVVAAVGRASISDAAAWEKSVAALPAEEQLKAVVERLHKLNPGFVLDKLGPRIEAGQVTELEVIGGGLRDLSPVRALPVLRGVGCVAGPSDTRVTPDLSALMGMNLRRVGLRGTNISEVTGLAALPLTGLELTATHVSDLSPLKGMPLTDLQIDYTPVKDLSPLRGMKLDWLNCDGSRVADLSPIAGQPLTKLNLRGTKVFNLGPLKGMPLAFLDYANCPVTDISPLKDLPLKEVRCDFQPARDAAILRSLRSLQTINGKPAEQLWQELDAR